MSEFSKHTLAHLAEVIIHQAPEPIFNKMVAMVEKDRPWRKLDFLLTSFMRQFTLFFCACALLGFNKASFLVALPILLICLIWNLFVTPKQLKEEKLGIYAILNSIRTRVPPTPSHRLLLPTLFSIFYAVIVNLYWLEVVPETITRWCLLIGALIAIERAVHVYPMTLFSYRIKKHLSVDYGFRFLTGTGYLLVYFIPLIPFAAFVIFAYSTFPFLSSERIIYNIFLVIGMPWLLLVAVISFTCWSWRLKLRYILNSISFNDGYIPQPLDFKKL